MENKGTLVYSKMADSFVVKFYEVYKTKDELFAVYVNDTFIPKVNSIVRTFTEAKKLIESQENI
jgi:hypothetical protein